MRRNIEAPGTGGMVFLDLPARPSDQLSIAVNDPTDLPHGVHKSLMRVLPKLKTHRNMKKIFAVLNYFILRWQVMQQ